MFFFSNKIKKKKNFYKNKCKLKIGNQIDVIIAFFIYGNS